MTIRSIAFADLASLAEASYVHVDLLNGNLSDGRVATALTTLDLFKALAIASASSEHNERLFVHPVSKQG